jgi:hypothetical protein
VKRILSALAAAASIAALALGAAGTANAEVKAKPPLSGVYIAEASFGPEERDFFKILAVNEHVTTPVSLVLEATFGLQRIPLATIPANVTFTPDMPYTIASIFSGVACAKQLFTTNLPEDFPIRVTLREKATPSVILDSALVPPLPESVPDEWSQHRTSFTPTRFTPAPAAPCSPESPSPVPAAATE